MARSLLAAGCVSEIRLDTETGKTHLDKIRDKIELFQDVDAVIDGVFENIPSVTFQDGTIAEHVRAIDAILGGRCFKRNHSLLVITRFVDTPNRVRYRCTPSRRTPPGLAIPWRGRKPDARQRSETARMRRCEAAGKRWICESRVDRYCRTPWKLYRS